MAAGIAGVKLRPCSINKQPFRSLNLLLILACIETDPVHPYFSKAASSLETQGWGGGGGLLESLPGDTGRRQGHTLDKSPVHRREKQILVFRFSRYDKNTLIMHTKQSQVSLTALCSS